MKLRRVSFSVIRVSFNVSLNVIIVSFNVIQPSKPVVCKSATSFVHCLIMKEIEIQQITAVVQVALG
jgi:hypothetical protein